MLGLTDEEGEFEFEVEQLAFAIGGRLLISLLDQERSRIQQLKQ